MPKRITINVKKLGDFQALSEDASVVFKETSGYGRLWFIDRFEDGTPVVVEHLLGPADGHLLDEADGSEYIEASLDIE